MTAAGAGEGRRSHRRPSGPASISRRRTPAAIAVVLLAVLAAWGASPALATEDEPPVTVAAAESATGEAPSSGRDEVAPPDTTAEGTADEGDGPPVTTGDDGESADGGETGDDGEPGDLEVVASSPAAMPDVHQQASGDVDESSKLHIEQDALVFSLGIEEGADADDASTTVEVVQIASGVARGGASLEIRQQAVSATVGRGATTTSSSTEIVEATGSSGRQRIVQTADVSAFGRVDAAVQQLAGVIGAGAAFAGPASPGDTGVPLFPAEATGTHADVEVGQHTVLQTSASVRVEQGAVVVSQGTAVASDGSGAVTWSPPQELDPDDAAELVDEVVEAANLVLEDHGLRLDFDPEEWTITLEVLVHDVTASPQPGFTVHQRVTAVSITFRRIHPTGSDGQPDEAPWETAPDLDEVADLVPDLEIDLELADVPPPAGAKAVGSLTNTAICQAVGATSACDPPPPPDDGTVDPPEPPAEELEVDERDGEERDDGDEQATADDDGEPSDEGDEPAGAAGGSGGDDDGPGLDVRAEVATEADGTVVAGVIEIRSAPPSRSGPARAAAAASGGPGAGVLARTGTETGVQLRLAALLVATGGVLTLTSRRLRRSPALELAVAGEPGEARSQGACGLARPGLLVALALAAAVAVSRHPRGRRSGGRT